MKTKVLIFLLFATIIANAQNAVGFSFLQDGKATFFDDKHGNIAPYFNNEFKIVLEGNEKKYGHWQIAADFEYAKLFSGEYIRFGAQGGYSLTNIPIFIKEWKQTITPMLGYGKLSRGNNQVLDSWQLTVEQTFEITKWFNFVISHELTDRREYDIWRYSLRAGVQFDVDTNFLKRQAEKGSRF